MLLTQNIPFFSHDRHWKITSKVGVLPNREPPAYAATLTLMPPPCYPCYAAAATAATDAASTAAAAATLLPPHCPRACSLNIFNFDIPF